MALTPEAKRLLAETIRGSKQSPEKGLRARLLRAIHDEADRRYRLSVEIGAAGLDEAHRRRRERIESWIDEQARASQPKGKTWSKKELADVKARLLAQAEKEAAATLINRLVLLRQLEALRLSRPALVTGGWNSPGYRQLREFAPTLCTNGTTDATEGYSTLLQLLFDELAQDLPGLFGDVGLTRLFPIPAATLREVIERLDDPELASAWTDDTTLGWVYQYWNDPDREALDDKINDGGKIAPHEIASKTQMFTERYMVEWLLQNSLGLAWLCICKKNGWTPDADRVFPELETRRADWRAKREAGEVALDELMPIEGELEDHWKYFVPQPIPDDAVQSAPDSIRTLKLLDPAVGSGHFLVIAFGMLVAMYREEARHRGETASDKEIAESILENNLYGIDIDPRAIQIGAATLYLRAKSLAKDAQPRTLNLVAPVLKLGNLPPDDPAVVQLRSALWNECGIPEQATGRLLQALAGVDYLGSLLRIDDTVEATIREAEKFQRASIQREMFGESRSTSVKFVGERQTIVQKLEQFLAHHASSQDLGLRLDGEQLAAGVRFVRMARETTYDVVVANPPYQALSKTEAFGYVTRTYKHGKADLYAAFIERGLEFAKQGGLSALVTMRGWMFLAQFTSLRTHLLRSTTLRSLGDLGTGAFSSRSMDDVITTVLTVILRSSAGGQGSAIQAGPLSDPRRDAGKPQRRLAALLCHSERYEFDPRRFAVIEGEPIVYWWTKDFLDRYAKAPKLGDVSPGRKGLCTGADTRFTRKWWEVSLKDGSAALSFGFGRGGRPRRWVPSINGGEGLKWFEPLREVCPWEPAGIEFHAFAEVSNGIAIRNPRFYFRRGIAFSMVGSECRARAHRATSLFLDKGSSVFPPENLIAATLCLMNSRTSAHVLASLNPTISFQVGDVNRLPMFNVDGAEGVYAALQASFAQHEAAREASAEFRRPDRSAWAYTQAWAQQTVDRAEGTPPPLYSPEYDEPAALAFLSFAIGVALGRFGARGEGILSTLPTTSLPGGILFTSVEREDSLDHPASAPIHAAWNEHAAAGVADDLRTYIRKSFFDYHKKVYENRPTYLPLSSGKKGFVAFVSIHHWQDNTLNTLLADHLVPARRRLEGDLEDLRAARAVGTTKAKTEARFGEVQKLLEELNDFIAKVAAVAEKGPPPPDDKTPTREVDARYSMDLDDGVLVNSAALWPLLEPQWKDPKKWWRELATAEGKKDYDWSHLAARYFPTRVRKKCHEDPSLAVAHKCFWELHPARAYAWELRLQDEIRTDVTIEEPGADAVRARFLAEREREAAEIRTAELKRRTRKTITDGDKDESGPLFENRAGVEQDAEIEGD